jgi:hypothetical protein
MECLVRNIEGLLDQDEQRIRLRLESALVRLAYDCIQFQRFFRAGQADKSAL